MDGLQDMMKASMPYNLRVKNSDTDDDEIWPGGGHPLLRSTSPGSWSMTECSMRRVAPSYLQELSGEPNFRFSVPRALQLRGTIRWIPINLFSLPWHRQR